VSRTDVRKAGLNHSLLSAGVPTPSPEQTVPRSIAASAQFGEFDVAIMAHGQGMVNSQFQRPGAALVQVSGLHWHTSWLSLFPGAARSYHLPIDRCGAYVRCTPCAQS
jgi:hypothetical protein